jgi:hypothetical protein
MINIRGLSGIYGIKNKINNKIYVGSSINIHSRLLEHIYDLKKKIHCNDYLQNSWNKYGENNFEFCLICKCEIENLLDNEQYYIDYLDSKNRKFGYNISPDVLRHKVSDSTRAKLKKVFSGENNPRWGKKGCTRNAEQLKQHAVSCSKPVVQFDLLGNEVATYKSLKDAAHAVGVHLSGISMCLKGKTKTCGKFIWKYGVKNFSSTDIKVHNYSSKEISKDISKRKEKQFIIVAVKPYKMSNETKRKISEALKKKHANNEITVWSKGKTFSAEYRKKISDGQIGRTPWNKGVPMKEEQKKKLSLACKGKKQTKETKAKRSESMKKAWAKKRKERNDK